MYASQKINTDPLPYLGIQGGRSMAPFVDKGERSVRAQRPEFDNSPNRVLEAFRDDCESQARVRTVGRCAEVWLRRGITARIKPATWGEIWHAQKVLRRIAAL